MKSVSAAASQERATRYSDTLFATDVRFHRVVHVIMQDGSVFLMRDAFAMVDPGDENYMWLIGEHYDAIAFALDEVDSFTQWGRLI